MNKHLKILIVDDEAPARKVLNKQLYELGYQDIHCAIDGLEAYEMIVQNTPDIVIADIKMSGMDGLELLKKIRENQYDTKFIFLSGYELFDYAKEAMKYQASDYLLKPVDTLELADVLNSLETEIDKNNLKSDYHKQFSVNKKILRQNYLEQLIFHSSLQLTDNSTEEEKKLDIHLPYETFMIALFRIYPNQIQEIPEDSSLLFFCIENVAKEILFEEGIYCYGFTSRKDFCLVCNLPEKYSDYEKNRSKLYELIRNIESFCKIKISPDFVMGVSFSTNRANLKQAFQSAQKSVEWQITSQQELYYKNQFITEKNNYLEKKQEYALYQALTKKDILACFSILEEIYYPFFYSLKGQKKTIDHLNIQLIMLFFKYLKECHIDSELLGDEFDLYQETASLSDEKLTLDWMKNKVYLCIEATRSTSNEAVNEQILKEQIQAYIKSHLSESITLESIATQFHFSPHHFSKLFKKIFGMNFIKFLTSCRIDEAKLLLATTDKKVSEIRDEIGFHDSKHFYKVFKNHTGLQPSAYRDRLK